MSYLDNDDDLFDYDPDLEADSSKDYSYTSFNEATKITSDDPDLDLSSSLSVLKINLATAFHSATTNHFSEVERPSFEKAICVTLDKLTNGDFTLLHMFYRKEMLISQRITFLSMMDIVMSNPEDSDSPYSNFLIQLFSKANVNITDAHVPIFYGTCISIARHSLIVDQAIYRFLGQKLNLPLKEDLLNPEFSSDKALNISAPVHNDFFNTVYPSVIRALSEDGLSDMLSSDFSTPINLISND